jgi:hypothetical protein
MVVFGFCLQIFNSSFSHVPIVYVTKVLFLFHSCQARHRFVFNIYNFIFNILFAFVDHAHDKNSSFLRKKTLT